MKPWPAPVTIRLLMDKSTYQVYRTKDEPQGAPDTRTKRGNALYGSITRYPPASFWKI